MFSFCAVISFLRPRLRHRPFLTIQLELHRNESLKETPLQVPPIPASTYMALAEERRRRPREEEWKAGFINNQRRCWMCE